MVLQSSFVQGCQRLSADISPPTVVYAHAHASGNRPNPHPGALQGPSMPLPGYWVEAQETA